MTLNEIAQKYDTDKKEGEGLHGYTTIYDKVFKNLRDTEKPILEIGIGGYKFEDRGGGSLSMWRDYFINAPIHGVDLFKKNLLDTDRIYTHQISQDDAEGLNKLIDIIGEPQIIIDDASHVNPLTIETFKILFPRLSEGGIYVVEDVHTNYWKEEYLGEPNYKDKEANTVMNFFLELCHNVNRDWIVGLESQFKITKIEFVKSLIFIYK